MMEICDLFSTQNLFKLQSDKPLSSNETFKLSDWLEEEDQGHLKNESIYKELNKTDTLDSEAKEAIAQHVVFEEDTEEASYFRVVCQLNPKFKSKFAIQMIYSDSKNLKCESYEIIRSTSSCRLIVKIDHETFIEFVLTIGVDINNVRILFGTYPISHVEYGRNFWIMFVKSMAISGCLLGQDLKLEKIPDTKKQNEELPDDESLEYDSLSEKSQDSECSVDSDPV